MARSGERITYNRVKSLRQTGKYTGAFAYHISLLTELIHLSYPSTDLLVCLRLRQTS
jgi:hypothetical protein